MKKISYRKVLFILIMSFLYTMAAYLGLFNRIDKWIQDDSLLHPQTLTGEVVVIGIADNSLDPTTPGIEMSWLQHFGNCQKILQVFLQ